MLSIEKMLAFDSRTGSKLSSLLHYLYGRFARSWQLPACFTCYVRTDACEEQNRPGATKTRLDKPTVG